MSTIRLLHSTDWHVTARQPKTRTDVFIDAITEKINDYYELGHELKVNAYLHTGDFIDTPYLTEKQIIRFGRLMENGLKDKPMFHIWGNHDEISYDPDSISRTRLGIFHEFNRNMHCLTRKPIMFEGIALTGVSTYPHLDKHIYDTEGNVVSHRNRDYLVKKDRDALWIHLVHGYLSERSLPDTTPHTLLKEIWETEADVTLTGHDHSGFPVTRMKHGYACNPGGLARVFAKISELNRMPKYTFIEMDTVTKTTHIETMPCRVALPGNQVLDRSELERVQAKEALLLETKTTVKELLQGVDIRSVDIEVLLSSFEGKIRPPVLTEVRNLLRLKNEELVKRA